jgi:hypothetical protein
MPTDNKPGGEFPSLNWGRTPSLDPPFKWRPHAWADLHMRVTDNYVRLRITEDDVALIAPRRRRWWQLWKPKTSNETLATKPHDGITAGDRVELRRSGEQFIATINDRVVLRHPEHARPARYQGFGMRGDGFVVSSMSDPSDSVEP